MFTRYNLLYVTVKHNLVKLFVSKAPFYMYFVDYMGYEQAM